MTFDEWVQKYKGSRIDYDNFTNVQCVDLARIYSKEVLGEDMGITLTGYACGYFTNPSDQVKKLFNFINNTPDFVPQKGDLMIWSSSLNGAAGHIAVCNGVGNKNYFVSYDYNWKGQNDGWTEIKHTYDHVLGVLRPKNQEKVLGKKTTTTKTLDTKGYTNGYKTIGSLAVKKLLLLAKKKGLHNATVDGTKGYGSGSIKAVNSLLNSWGYAQNGIAGDNFIKTITSKIKSKTTQVKPITKGKVGGIGTMDKTGYTLGCNVTCGSLAMKELLTIAYYVGIQPYKVDENGIFGKGTRNAVNYLLMQFGNYPNSVAGENFINRLYKEIAKKI